MADPQEGPVRSGPSLLRVAAVLVRERRLIVGLPLAFGVVVAAVTLFSPARYTAYALFAPQAAAGAGSRVAGLAAQFGVALPATEAGTSPQFYADLLGSDDMLRSLAGRPVVLTTDSGIATLSLPAWLGVDDGDSARRLSKGADKLRDHLTIGVRAQTGVVRVGATTRDPSVSEAIVRNALDLLNRFNIEVRQTQALQESRFLKERVEEIQIELREAEDSLQAFLQTNRDIRNSPQLLFTRSRLERAVDLKQQLFTSVAQAFEQAQADAVRNTPVITIVAPARRPAVPDHKFLLLKVALAVGVGAIVSAFLALGREYLRWSKEADPEEADRLRSALRAASDGLRRRPRASQQ